MRQPRRNSWLKFYIFLIVYPDFHSVLSAPSEPGELKLEPVESDKLNEILFIREKLKNGNVDKVNEVIMHSEKEANDYEKKEISESSITLQKVTDVNYKENRKEGIGKVTDTVETTEEKKVNKKPKRETEEASQNEEVKFEKEYGRKKRQNVLEELPNQLSTTTAWTYEEEYRTLRPMRSCSPPAIEQFPRPLMSSNMRRHGGLIIHVLVAIFAFVGLAVICREYFVNSLGRICEELKLAPDVAGATFMAAGSSAPELATVITGVFWAQDDIGVSRVIGPAVFNIMFVISLCALCAGTVSHLNWWPLCRDCFFYAVAIFVMLYTIWDGRVTWVESMFMLGMYMVYGVALHFNATLESWSARLAFKRPTKQADHVTYESGSANGAFTTDEQYAQATDTTQQAPVCDPNLMWNSETSEQQSSASATAPPQTDDNHAAILAATDQQITAQAVPVQTCFKHNKSSVNPLERPLNASPWQLACWTVAYPVHWSARHTIPDCCGRWYPVTFLVSMLWISLYSYYMVWMITIIGTTLTIPDTVMGLTFVAAGVSLVTLLSSLTVIKERYGDMAVSNAVGSNVFDILVCLGLPWFIQTAIIMPGSSVNVISKGLVYSTLSLFSTVVFLVVATHANGWKLDRKFGIILMVCYLLFIAFASLYELNVFGNFHPPDCQSMY